MPKGITEDRPVSHWLIERTPCPKCGAAANEQCRDPRGVRTYMPHFARREQAITDGHYKP